MTKYIDADRLRAKIEKYLTFDENIDTAFYIGRRGAERSILALIDTLQQEQPDNEDIDKVAQELYEHLYELKRRNNVPTNLYDKQEIIELWKAGIEYGRNHTKQEQPAESDVIKGGDFISDGKRVFLVLANVKERNLGETGSTFCEGHILGVDGVVYCNGDNFKKFKRATLNERVKFIHDLKVGVELKEQPKEDLEEEVEEYLDGFIKMPTREYFRKAIKHFYSRGLNARKEQPEVDLEEYIENEVKHYGLSLYEASYGTFSASQIDRIIRNAFEFGLNARKEE